MAVKSVTQANLAEYVGERRAMGSKISETPPAVVESAVVAVGEDTITPKLATEVAPKPEEKQRKNSVQDRIDELTREKKELEELAETEYEARLQSQRRISELESQLKSIQPEVKKPEPKPRPDRSKYTDPDQSENDLLAWNRERAIEDFRGEEQKKEQERIQQEANAALVQHTEAAKQAFPDFQRVIEEADKTVVIPDRIKPLLNAVAVESDYGVHVLYHLAKNPEEAQTIFKMKPAAALLALGRIEQKYMASPPVDEPAKTPKPNVSKAPAPVVTLNGGGEGAVVTDISQPMPFKDYKQRRIDQIRKKRH